MNKKLVMLDSDRIVTGDKLKEILIEMNFDVPDVEPAARYVSPPRVTLHAGDEGYNAACEARKQAMQEAYAIYLADLTRMNLEVAYVANLLAGIFTIATKVVVGQNPNGTKKREWKIVPTAYTFSQAAQKLTGIYAVKPVDEIEFICYNEF